jgi:hypothetical protein
MPLYSLCRLLIYKEKEAHREKMHVHPGSYKNIFIWEIGAVLTCNRLPLMAVIYHPASGIVC